MCGGWFTSERQIGPLFLHMHSLTGCVTGAGLWLRHARVVARQSHPEPRSDWTPQEQLQWWGKWGRLTWMRNMGWPWQTLGVTVSISLRFMWTSNISGCVADVRADQTLSRVQFSFCWFLWVWFKSQRKLFEKEQHTVSFHIDRICWIKEKYFTKKQTLIVAAG